MKLFYFGFNLRQVGDTVIFGSAPGTGASLLAEKFTVTGAKTLSFTLQVDGAEKSDTLKIELGGTAGEATLTTPIITGMHRYELTLPDDLGEIKSLRICPSAIECVLSVKEIIFE